MTAAGHHQRQGYRPANAISLPPPVVTASNGFVDILLDKNDGLSRIILSQLINCQTGSLAMASGWSVKPLKDNQTALRVRGEHRLHRATQDNSRNRKPQQHHPSNSMLPHIHLRFRPRI
jgi:hypothetical protein